MYRISIFHYHLQPGGVTSVIELGAEALIRYLPDLQLLRIVSGTSDNADKISRNLKAVIEKAGLDKKPDFRFEISIEPLIAYNNPAGKLSQNEIAGFSHRLEQRYGDSLWWVHNYQLGKNPLFTAAIINCAAAAPSRKMLLHIHDFPECARFENLSRLLSAGVENPYPVSPNIIYSLINGRDLRLLNKAGIPSDRLYLVNNPVESPPEDSAAYDRIRLKRFYQFFSGSFPAVMEDGKTIFYPVRSIRRKNILEAGLVCAAASESVNLVVGLPGTSAAEKAYSDICGQCFKDGLIPGVWGSGTVDSPEVPSYHEMLSLCDLIISSSVQEGFGYLFINAVQLKKPLMARNLDILDGIRTVFPSDSVVFYQRINVPIEEQQLKKLKSSYREKFSSLNSHLSPEALSGLERIIDSASAEKMIDFSYLPVEQQITVLKKIKDSSDYSLEVRKLNSSLFSDFSRLLMKEKTEQTPDLGRFSLKSHAGTVEEIFNILLDNRQDGNTKKNYPKKPTVQQNLIDEFAKIDYMRLIYDYR